MGLTLDQFCEQISSSGLLGRDELQAMRSEAKPADAQALARELVRQKKLTAFQAQQCYSGKGKSLVLGNYVLLDKLGQGGMGMVLKAEHRRMKRIVALKVLAPKVARDKELKARFQREVEAAARLSHPHIVAAFDADEANGTVFLVMEYVEGRDLSSVVRTKGPLPVDQAVGCILQAARGLEYAHQQGIIHRDIKPANLLLSNQGTVKILDMGLARIENEVGSQAELTSTGAVMGTIDYMAPEQALSTKRADARSDIYSLGIALWYLLAGRPAYEGDSLMARMLAHRESPIPSLRGARGEVPAALDETFRRMVAKAPEERFQSMTEVIHALEHSLRGEASAPSMSLGPSEDSRLDEFLAHLGGGAGDASQSTALASTKALPQASTQEATLITSDSDVPTDPQTLTRVSQAVSRSSSRRISRAPGARPALWKDRRIVGSALGVAAVLIAVVMLSRGGDEALTSGGNNSAAVATAGARDSAPVISENAGRRPTAAAPPEIALRFTSGGFKLPDDLKFDGSHPLTIEAWVLLDEDATASQTAGLGHVCMHPLLRIDYDYAASSWSLGSQTETVPFYRTSPSPHFSGFGEWTHVAGVLNNNSLTLYVNGIQRLSEQLPSALHLSLGSDAFFIADGPEAGAQQFDGCVDEVRISRVARYSGDFEPVRRFASDPDTLALYHFDEGSGTEVRDSSPHRRHASLESLESTGGIEWVRADGGAAATAPPAQFALQFDGVDDSVEIPTLAWDGVQPVTIEGWMTLPEHQASSPASFFQLAGDPSHSEAFDLRMYFVYGQLEIPPDKAPGIHLGLNRPERFQYRGFPPPVRGRAFHFAAVIDGDERRLFIDGRAAQGHDGSYDRPSSPEETSSLRQRWRFPTRIGGVDYPGSPNGSTARGLLTGQYSGLRVSKSAKYREDFEPPRVLTADAETLALYRFDEGSGDVLHDASGHGHHGKILGAAWRPLENETHPRTSAATRAFDRGGLVFDGSDDHVDITSDWEWDGKELTVDAWVIPEAWPHFGFLTIVDHGDRETRRSARIGRRFWENAADGNYDRFALNTAPNPLQYLSQISPPMPVGVPVHIAAVWRGSEGTLFINGEPQAMQPAGYAFADRTVPRYTAIGALKSSDPTGAKDGWRGAILQLRITDAALYDKAFEPPAHLSALPETVGLYLFEEGSGDVLRDLSGHGHDGKIIGARWR